MYRFILVCNTKEFHLYSRKLLTPSGLASTKTTRETCRSNWAKRLLTQPVSRHLNFQMYKFVTFRHATFLRNYSKASRTCPVLNSPESWWGPSSKRGRLSTGSPLRSPWRNFRGPLQLVKSSLLRWFKLKSSLWISRPHGTSCPSDRQSGRKPWRPSLGGNPCQVASYPRPEATKELKRWNCDPIQ